MDACVKDAAARCVTIAHMNGHEFEFEAPAVGGGTKLFAERWSNRRLPLNADTCREAARRVAEQRFRERGLI